MQENLPCFDCGKSAKWLYMPASEKITEAERWKCDKHVPRGCSCNSYPVDDNPDNDDPENWQEEVDEQGRKFPCCEWEELGQQ